jgi:hypothetical protein
VPKGDMASREHPIFTLSTKPDFKLRRHERGENCIEVSPLRYGLTTVHDLDVICAAVVPRYDDALGPVGNAGLGAISLPPDP